MIDVLKKRWMSSGLSTGDNILLHTSLKRTFADLKRDGYSIKPIDILESFIDLIGSNGTLIIPTFNFDFNNGVPYDYILTTSQTGIMTEIARNHPSATRTLNPVYSFAVFGKEANLFKGIDNESWYSKKSPFDLILKMNAKIVIIDLNDRNSMTFAHYCEEIHQVPWRYYKKFTGKYTGPNKITLEKTYLGYVRDEEKGVITTLNPAGELLWERKFYKGNKPFQGSGLRYVTANDYYNLFNELFKKNKCKPYYYDIKSR